MRKMTALLCCAIVYTAHAQVTIDNLLSVPFPTELHSSPDGKHIAWVFNDKGVRNVYMADAPAFSARKVTSNTADNGIDITGLSFSQDGNLLVFIMGNTANRSGEAANPAGLQQQTGEEVWMVHTDGTGLRKIGAGTNPMVGPGGATIYFNLNDKVWQAPVADTSVKPSQLFDARGGISDLRWSPDGQKLAFISNRGDHAFLGIYDTATKNIEYPDPSVDIDLQPVWSPDGKTLAYIRVPNRKDALPFKELREGSPWSIRLLNVATGNAKQLWKADEGPGSVLFGDFPVADNFLLWCADGEIVFPWEKDGWQHLYAKTIESDIPPRLLTPGNGEVENMYLSPDKQSVVFNSNIDDSHRRHIWKVDINNGPLVTRDLTIETGVDSVNTGIEWSPVYTTAGIVALRSTATTPGWPVLITGHGDIKKLATELFPSSFPAASLVTPVVVTFPAKDGMPIHGELFLPPGYDASKKYPALLFFHGGSRRQMLLGFHYMGYYSNDYAMNQYYASRGYIVLAVNYRSGIGYGLNFREALHYGANGASEYNDVLGAGLYMRSRKDVDPEFIGLWGGSYGGYLTAMGLSRNSDIFTCGVDIHGVHDWNEEMKNWVANYDPATRASFAATAIASSPVHFVAGWKSPVLLIHGDDDRNVPFSQTVNMVEKLREHKIYFEQLVIPDEIHDFLLHKTWIKGYYAAADFFDRMRKRKM